MGIQWPHERMKRGSAARRPENPTGARKISVGVESRSGGGIQGQARECRAPENVGRLKLGNPAISL